MLRLCWSLLFGVLLFCVLFSEAQAKPLLLQQSFEPVKSNPANLFKPMNIDTFFYEPASKCKNQTRKGINLATDWLYRHASGEFWGSFRCEKWGKHKTSLYAENRAIDWQLDVRNRIDKSRHVTCKVAFGS